MSCLPKPVLRGHVRRVGAKIIASSIVFGIANATLFHYLVGAPKIQRFHEFFKNYDPEAHYKELCKYGYMSTAGIKGD